MNLDPTMLRIDNEKQLFLDDLLIESAENICRTWHKPEKYQGNPILQPDQPWEHILELTVNGFQVIYDKKYRVFKCWYTDRNCSSADFGSTTIKNSRHNILYAESIDGINWYKPLCGKGNGNTGTNIVISDGKNLALAIDFYEKDERKRYKGLYTSFKPCGDCDSVHAVYSEDGKEWHVHEESPSFGRCGSRTDDVIVMSYDPVGRLFIVNMRHYDMYAINSNRNNPTVGMFTPPYYPLNWSRMAKRRVWQAESPDAVHWSQPYPVMTPMDGCEELDEAFYGMCQYRTGDIVIGFLNSFRYVSNDIEVKLVYSRNGKTWTHLNNRRTFLGKSEKGSWDDTLVAIPTPPIEYDGKLLFYYGGAVNHHDWWMTGKREGLPVPEAYDMDKVRYQLGLAVMRMDGFASLGATVRPGILITRHFISSGRHLEINAKCKKDGFIKAEIVDANDHVIPGFGYEDSDAFTGDSIGHELTWKGKAELPVVNMSRPIYPEREGDRLRKIRFHIKDADLYSFTLKG